MAFVQEFKEFALKGNVIDMAVGIIIGAAFNKIVNSLVQDIVMPPIGMIVGGVDFKNLVIHLKDPVLDPTGKVVQEAVNIRYGLFINNVIEFLIIALTVFVVVKVMGRIIAQRLAPIASRIPGLQPPPAPPAPPAAPAS
jgi:large conductance mechanosensitive channel